MVNSDQRGLEESRTRHPDSVELAYASDLVNKATEDGATGGNVRPDATASPRVGQVMTELPDNQDPNPSLPVDDARQDHESA